MISAAVLRMLVRSSVEETSEKTRRLPSASALLGVTGLSCALALGCVEDGTTPDCPVPEEFLSEDQELDEEWRSSPEFEAWRTASEEAGCLTPLGGSQPDDSENDDDGN